MTGMLSSKLHEHTSAVIVSGAFEILLPTSWAACSKLRCLTTSDCICADVDPFEVPPSALAVSEIAAPTGVCWEAIVRNVVLCTAGGEKLGWSDLKLRGLKKRPDGLIDENIAMIWNDLMARLSTTSYSSKVNCMSSILHASHMVCVIELTDRPCISTSLLQPVYDLDDRTFGSLEILDPYEQPRWCGRNYIHKPP